jgi:lysophospholipase L1-like esterase
LLAGQSNMQGHGALELERDGQQAKGTLKHALSQSPNGFLMRPLQDDQGNWSTRDDVIVWYQTGEQLKAGPLTAGFTGHDDKLHFGPEWQLGQVLGDAFDEPVLLVKTAWGGKSLETDFRPPSSGGATGPLYIEMLQQLATAVDNAPQRFESLAGKPLRLQGVFWMQGWNDMVDETANQNYAENLQNLIKDLRKQFNDPDLPFVYGELGNGGPKTKNQRLLNLRQQQLQVAKLDLPQVRFVETTQFARPANQSPHATHLHHWFGNAESYFLVGDALGRAMVDVLMPPERRKQVLILGDSISMGYTPHVARLFSPAIKVIRPNRNGRPENCQGTDNGLPNLERWLKLEGGNWDLIHFNFGLHDLKRVDPETGKNSNNAEHPYQSSPEEYRQQLRTIVQRLMQTDAKLVLCTTTPVPAGVKPYRATTDPAEYNRVAREVIGELDPAGQRIAINDLFAFADARLDQIQRPANVHFTGEGSKVLATEVARIIRKQLEK